MAIPFSIPNAQQYMVTPTRDYLSQPSLGDQPLDFAAADPIQAQLIAKILEAVNAQPPTAPPRKKRGKIANFILGGTPMYEKEKEMEYEQSPEYAQYAQQMQKYEAGQKSLGPLSAVSGALGRGGLAEDRERRLREQFSARMAMDRYETQKFNYNGGPGIGNMEIVAVHDKLTEKYYEQQTGQELDISRLSMPIHQIQYPGPGGDPVTFSTSQLPQTPQVPRTVGAPGGASAGAPGITVVPRPTEGGQTAGQRPSNIISAPMPRRGQSPQLTRPPSGQAHAAPAGAAENVAHRTAFAIGLDPIIGIQIQANKAQVGMFGQASADPLGLGSLAGQNIADYTARSPSLQPLLQNPSGRNILNYNINMQPSLFAYTKSQTGAQFGMQEFDRYRSSFPTSMDDEFTATEKIGSLLRVVRADVIASQAQFHGVEVDPRFTAYIGRAMSRSRFNQMRAEDRIAFVAGGGIVKE